MLRLFILASLCVCGCAPRGIRGPGAPVSLTWFDARRDRPISLLYGWQTSLAKPPLAIISPGYGVHNSAYSFIAADLVARGYLVASIEHSERPGDPPMANSGDLAKLRRPVWQIGAESIGFVIDEMGRRGIADTARGVLLVGHSNGGDMTMLFATEHPNRVAVALSLDNRRMPLPRVRQPRICSLRSSDYAADPKVLPSARDQADLHMMIVSVPVRHEDMWDGASPAQRTAMLKAIGRCLDRR